MFKFSVTLNKFHPALTICKMFCQSALEHFQLKYEQVREKSALCSLYALYCATHIYHTTINSSLETFRNQIYITEIL